MTICLYQGTFNPIHLAHIRVAKYAREKLNFSKVIFIPSYIPPHKLQDDCSFVDKLEMVKLATADNDYFDVSDIEYRKKGISYTYLTIMELQKELKTTQQFNFIIGTDAFEKIETWYESQKLKELVKFILFKRDYDYCVEKFDLLREKGYNFELMDMDFIDISSSAIKNKIKNNQSVDGLLDFRVEEYIRKNGLYKN